MPPAIPRNKRQRPAFLALFAGGILYPVFVYFGIGKIPPSLFAVLGLCLIGARLWVLREQREFKLWAVVFSVACGALLALLILAPANAPKAYPIVVSLSIASVFALSLVFPPTIVERIARLSEPELPPHGVRYAQGVTIVWVIFLLLNAAISAATAIFGSLRQWTLWNGCISYVLMGSLFAAEYMVRRLMRKAAQQ